ncbi:homeodomain-like protein [Tanacetum coccineum]
MASPTRSTPPTINASNTMIASGHEVDLPIRAQPTRIGTDHVTLPSFSSGAFSGSKHLPPPFTTYGRCNKNQASNTSDGIVLDGCGEFMPQQTTTDPNDPSSLICDACGCHRSFHREHMIMHPMHNFVDYLFPLGRSCDTPSPTPVYSSYYPSLPFPHMFSAFNSNGLPPHQHLNNNNNNNPIDSPFNRNKDKRHRSKFSQEQKDKMLELARRVGWKIQKNNDEMVMIFCNEIRVSKSNFRVWMHNNKKKHVKGNNGVNGSPSSS